MRNATCAVCGTRIDVDETKQCPNCEAARARVRGYRPTLRPANGTGAVMLRAVGWFLAVMAVVAVGAVMLGAVKG